MQGDINAVPKMQEKWADHCAYCGAGIDEVEFTIHRDGPEGGPQVPLCNNCGAGSYPSIQEIWAKIANPDPLIEAMKHVNEMKYESVSDTVLKIL